MSFLSIPFLNAITDIGDSAGLSAAAVITTIYLLKLDCRREGTVVIASFLITAFIIILIRIITLGCGESDSYFSPSGHVALSTAFFGSCAILLSAQLKRWHRFIPSILAVLLIMTISTTRILLGCHSLNEVITGLLIGGLTLLIVWNKLLYKKQKTLFDMRILILLVVLSIWIFHGIHMVIDIEKTLLN